MQVPSFDVIRSGRELVVIPSIEDACLMEDGTSPATLGGNANERDSPVNPSSWENIATLLKSVPCFTTPDSPASGVNAFFLMTRRHFVELCGNLHLAGVVRPSHGTPESVLRCTYPMQKYTAEETTKVVRFAPSFPQTTPMLIPGQLKNESSLRHDGESCHSGARI